LFQNGTQDYGIRGSAVMRMFGYADFIGVIAMAVQSCPIHSDA
jgi:hypothetical protein